MPELGSTQMTMLWASVILGLVHVALAAGASVAARGMPWALGSRDDAAPAMGKMGSRLDRTWKNFLETFPLFAAAVLVEVAGNGNAGLAALGAQLYFWGRIAYLPIYAIGLPVVRTLVWTVSVVGIALVLVAVIPGV
jgi:uncharacterized MAPEG superfamily protein